MLYRLKKLIGMSISATDDDIGQVSDIYFDDSQWTVRYLVVDSSRWLEKKRVLISPYSVTGIDWDKGLVEVDMTVDKVRNSPDIDTARPVSRQHEIELFNYYGYPDYWNGGMLWGSWPQPMPAQGEPLLPIDDEPVVNDIVGSTTADPHLRSAQEVIGYHLHATDGAIGHLEDFIVDKKTWSLRYGVVDTRNWLPGKHVVIAPAWIKKLDWGRRRVEVDVSQKMIQQAPEYDPAIEFTRLAEEGLYEHYQQPRYWR